MFIDSSYFISELAIPNTNALSVSTNLDYLIDRYEKQVLRDMLGYPLFKELASDPTATKFDGLVNGAEFEFNYNGYEVSEKWIGLKGEDKKSSVLAYLVFYHYVANSLHQLNSSGVDFVESQNSENASPISLMTWAWNTGIDLYGFVPNGFNRHESFSYIHYDDSPSAYNYLLANMDVFANWKFTQKGYVNVFNL